MRFVKLHNISFNYKNYYIFAYQRGDFSLELSQCVADDLALNMPLYKIEDYFLAKPNILVDSDWVFIAHDIHTHQVIGVLSINWIQGKLFSDSINIKTILIAPSFQKTQLIRHFFASMLKVLQVRNGKPNSFSIKTTNPVSYMALRIFSRISDTQLYPDILKPNLNKIDVSIVKEMAKCVSPDQAYCLATSLYLNGGGRVPDDFYPVFPESKSSVVNHYFKEHVWPNNRLFAILFIDTDNARNELMRVLGV